MTQYVDWKLGLLVEIRDIKIRLQTLERNICDEIDRENKAFDRIMAEIRKTESGVTGAPCATEVQWNEKPETHVHDVAIPEERIEKIADCGE